MKPYIRDLISAQTLLPAIVVCFALTMINEFTAPNVMAHGQVTEYKRNMAGPYEIMLSTFPANPVVGSLHLTVNLMDLSSGTYIIDAKITLTGTGPGAIKSEIGPLVASLDPETPINYDVDTWADRTGTWNFEILVTADKGTESTDFKIEVKKNNPLLGLIALLMALVLLIIVGLSARKYLSQRRAPNEPKP